jgi:excisionase family DNA binding protein
MTNNGDVLKPWNTINEVARYLRVSPRTVARRIQAGLLHARKDGHLVRVRRARVWEYENRR